MIKRITILLAVLMMMLSVSIFPVQAAEAAPAENGVTAASADDDAAIIATDVIEYYYRIYNGKIQYRRWNATRGKWVDSHWITMS